MNMYMYVCFLFFSLALCVFFVIELFGFFFTVHDDKFPRLSSWGIKVEEEKIVFHFPR